MFSNRINRAKPSHTRKINPKMGLMGFLGFLGFAGFIPYWFHATEAFPIPTFFFFFTFFGFFGFYYEGKMSNTLIDERFELNRYRAESIANKTGLILIIGVTILSFSIIRIGNAYDALSLLIAAIGFAFGLSIFLASYLLYRFENEE